jgi:hypothetical protein
MNITTQELKQLIRESVYEMLASVDTDVKGQIEAYKQELLDCLNKIKNNMDDSGECEQRVGEINKEITDMLHDPSVSEDDKRVINMDHELDGLLGQVDKLAKGGLKETWEESISSGDLEEAIMTEKAPPGMEPWVKANKERFVQQYGQKKGLGVVYATAWKMFYKKKNK